MTNDLNLSGSIPLPTPTTGTTQTSGTEQPAKGFSTSDSISSSGGTTSTSGAQSYSPELMEALYVMWFSNGLNPIVLENKTGTTDSATRIDPANFSEKVADEMMRMCLDVLDKWSESIKKEIEEDKKKMNSPGYQDWLARNGKSGYESYLNTLTSEQVEQIQTYPNLAKSVSLGEGGMAAIQNYVRTVEGANDPAMRDRLLSLTSAVVIGNALRYDYAAPGSAGTGTIIPIQPVQEANDEIFLAMAPNQAAELGYLGALFASAAAYTSLGQTLQTSNLNQPGVINLGFAQNYATNILKSLNSSDFNSFCMTLLAHSMEGGETPTREQLNSLVTQVKVTLLSTSLALLYKMESSAGGGQGGGITGQEFLDLINGNVENVSNLDKQLASTIKALLDSMPLAEANALKATLVAWIDDTAQKNTQLLNVNPLISSMVSDLSPEIGRG